jgi:hypothetical protein
MIANPATTSPSVGNILTYYGSLTQRLKRIPGHAALVVNVFNAAKVAVVVFDQHGQPHYHAEVPVALSAENYPPPSGAHVEMLLDQPSESVLARWSWWATDQAERDAIHRELTKLFEERGVKPHTNDLDSKSCEVALQRIRSYDPAHDEFAPDAVAEYRLKHGSDAPLPPTLRKRGQVS